MQETINQEYKLGLPEIDVTQDDTLLFQREKQYHSGEEMNFEEVDDKELEKELSTEKRTLGLYWNRFTWARSNSSYLWCWGWWWWRHCHGRYPYYVSKEFHFRQFMVGYGSHGVAMEVTQLFGGREDFGESITFLTFLFIGLGVQRKTSLKF